MIETIDTPDQAALLQNIQYNLNLLTFLFQVGIGFLIVYLICRFLYDYFKDCAF